MQKGTIGTKQEEPGCSCYRRNYALLLSQIQEEAASLVAKLWAVTDIKRTGKSS
jgi:hypothetical protein